MNDKIKLAIMISGRGSNMEAILRACQYLRYPAEVVSVVADRHSAAGISRAISYGVDTTVIPFVDRAAFAEAVDDVFQGVKPDLVVLAGLMRILPATFVERWRTINIHPSLLPDFPGLNPHHKAIEAKVNISGCTVHWAAPEVDAGTIISQMTVPVFRHDTPADLAARVLVQEHRLYPMTIRLLATQILSGQRIGLNEP